MTDSPQVDGEVTLADVEPDNKLETTAPDRENRRREVEGLVKVIIFKGKYGIAVGRWGEQLGITYSWALARDCYVAGLMAGTIHFASTAVECAINHDKRSSLQRRRKWRMIQRGIILILMIGLG